MLSRYGLLCEVADRGSFSQVAEKFGYAQSSVSQAVKAVEEELGVCLLERKRNGIAWTADGRIFEPYLRAIYSAERALEQKRLEMTGMENTVIRIGTFTSVSRDILPPLMTAFRQMYPGVSFELYQGDYNNIHDWIETGYVELGFISEAVTEGLTTDFLYEDQMLVVVPPEHPLSGIGKIPLAALTEDPFILLDEGHHSTILSAFDRAGLSPRVAYRVYDDYSIMSMVRHGLGVSILFANVVNGYEKDVAVRALAEPISRRICLACGNAQTLSYSARAFRQFVLEHL